MPHDKPLNIARCYFDSPDTGEELTRTYPFYSHKGREDFVKFISWAIAHGIVVEVEGYVAERPKTPAPVTFGDAEND